MERSHCHDSYKELENERSTPRCLTVQRSMRPSLLRFVQHWWYGHARHACKRHAPASVKEERATRYMCVWASNQAWVCACVCHIHSSSVNSYLCMSEGALGSAYKRRAPRRMCVCAHDQAWVWVCVSLSSSLYRSRHLLVSVCMLRMVNDCKFTRQVRYCL